MSLLPESPRKRRRLVGIAIVVLATAATSLTIVLLPKAHPAKETFSNQPAQLATAANLHLSTVDRHLIDTTVDNFLLAGLDRRNPAEAWALAGPEMRSGSSLSEWKAGNLPLPRFDVAGTHFTGGWTQVDVERDSVSFNVIVQPRNKAKVGAMALSMEVIRQAGSWVVNRAYPVATFTPVGKPGRVVGPNDYGPNGRGQPTPDRGKVAGKWIGVPVALFLLGLAVVGLILSRNWRRYRRARKTFGDEGHVMPSLPQSYRDPDRHSG